LIGIVFTGGGGEGDDIITPMSGVKFAHEAKHKPNLLLQTSNDGMKEKIETLMKQGTV